MNKEEIKQYENVSNALYQAALIGRLQSRWLMSMTSDVGFVNKQGHPDTGWEVSIEIDQDRQKEFYGRKLLDALKEADMEMCKEEYKSEGKNPVETPDV